MFGLPRPRRLFAACAVAAVAALGGLTSSASAASAPVVASAASATHTNAFATEAIAAGLSASQVGQVQQEVNTFIARSGGTQVALNKVEFPGGSMVFAVSGTASRQLTAEGVLAPLSYSCPYGDFCGFEGNYFSGSEFEASLCDHLYPITWNVDTGSWINNQTPGTELTFYNQNYQIIGHTPPAYSQALTGNWIPVWYVMPC